MRELRNLPIIILVCVVGGLAPSVAWTQTAAVVAVVPEGAVIDAAELPDVAVGAKFTFRHAQGDGNELAQGSVLEVRDGRALIAVPRGSGVQAGDVAVACASAASQAQLRQSLEQVRAQVTAGSATPETQQLMAELDAAVQARDAAIQSGACDVSATDQTISALGVQLQQALATSPAATSPPQPVASTGSQPDVASGGGTPGSSGGTDSLGQIIDAVGRLFQMAKSLGLGSGGSDKSETGSSSSPAPSFPSSDTPVADPPPSSQFGDPVAGVTPTTPAPPPTTGVISPPPPSAPPPVAGAPPKVSPPPSAPPPVAGAPPKVSPPPSGAAPPSTGGSRPPWWTVKPKPVAPAPGEGAATGSAPPAVKPAPGIGVQPTITVPGTLRPIGPVAAAKPGLIRGTVLSSDGRQGGTRPLAGASVLVSDGRADTADRRVTTNAQGLFAVAGLPAGHYNVVVTAPGFRSANAAVSLAAGEFKPVSPITLQPQVAPIAPAPRRLPTNVQPAHPRLQSP